MSIDAPSPRPAGPVPGLFNRQTINFIIATSGIGKTKFLLNQLENYATGGGFLNYAPPATGPEQMGMIVCSRKKKDIERTLTPYPFLSNPNQFPIVMWKPEDGVPDYTNLVKAYEGLHQYLVEGNKVKFLIIKNIQFLLTSGKILEIKAVKDFCVSLHQFCEDKEVTIVGTTGMPKMKSTEIYPQLSDRIPGGGIWAPELNTLIGVEWTKLYRPVELRPPVRKITVQLQEGPAEIHWGKFGADGRMDVSPDYIPVDDPSATEQLFLDRLEKAAAETTFKPAKFKEWAEEWKVDPKTVTLWATEAIRQGILRREGNTNRLIYIKCPIQ
jgi:hypothetical protein